MCRGFSRAGQCVYSCDYNDFSTVSNDQKPEQHQECNQARGRAEVAAYKSPSSIQWRDGAETLKPQHADTTSDEFTSATASHRVEQRLT